MSTTLSTPIWAGWKSTLTHHTKCTWTYFRTRAFAEYVLIRDWRIWTIILLTGIVQFVHNLSHNYVGHLAGVYGVYGGAAKQLTDMGFKAFDSMPALAWAPNMMLFLGAALASAVVVSTLFTNYLVGDKRLHALQIIWRSCIVCCTAVCCRIICFFVTILPSPAEHCSEARYQQPSTTADFFLVFDTEHGCSDLIFSSHMLYGLIAVCTTTHCLVIGNRGVARTIAKKIVHALVLVVGWFMILFEGLAIVRQRTHYSIDVVGALMVVPLLWIAYLHFLPVEPLFGCLPREDVEEENKPMDDTCDTPDLDVASSVQV